MEENRQIYKEASERMLAKHGQIRDTYQHVFQQTVRFLDPQNIAKRVDRLIRTPLVANAFDSDVVRELQQSDSIQDLSEKAQGQLERIIGRSDFLPAWFLERGAELRRTVAKVQARSPAGKTMAGTGFLVGPGLLLTNAHVLDWSDIGENSLEEIVHGSLAIFDFEELADGSLSATETFRLAPDKLLLFSPWNELDYVLVALEPISTSEKSAIEDYGYNRLTADLGKIAKGEPVYIIQHPRGEPKQIVVNENRLIERDDASPYLMYQADTDQGSSGSPVFNRQWEVVALHHAPQIARDSEGRILALSGNPWQPEEGQKQIKFLDLNEGIRISKIVTSLDEALKIIETSTLSAPQKSTTEGTRLLQEMLATKHGVPPSALVKSVPVAKEKVQVKSQRTTQFAAPD